METSEFALIALDTKEEIKTCNTCKNIRGNREYTENSLTWQCFKAPFGIDVLTGNKLYELCVTVRNNGNDCGILGKWYEKYEKPVYNEPNPTIGGKDVKELPIEAPFSPEELEESRKRAMNRVAEIKAKQKLKKDDLSNL